MRECIAQRKSRVARLDDEATAELMVAMAVPAIVLFHFSNPADIKTVGKTAISLLNLTPDTEPKFSSESGLPKPVSRCILTVALR